MVLGARLGSPSDENMGDFVLPQMEEKIETLQVGNCESR